MGFPPRMRRVIRFLPNWTVEKALGLAAAVAASVTATASGVSPARSEAAPASAPVASPMPLRKFLRDASFMETEILSSPRGRLTFAAALQEAGHFRRRAERTDFIG